MSTKIISFLFTLIFFLNLKINAQEYTLAFTEETQIQLDFETSFDGTGFIEDAEHYYFLDRNRDNIHIAIIDKSSLIQVGNIHIQPEGPSAIKNPFSLVCINDKVGVYEFYSGKIKIIDQKGDLSETILTFPSSSGSTGVMPLFMNPILNNSEHLIISRIAGIDFATRRTNYDSTAIIKLNMVSKETSRFLKYPENYQNPILGGRQSIFSVTKSAKNDEYVVSFPLDHHLYLIKNNQVEKKKVEGLIFDDFEGHFFNSYDELKNPNYKESKQKFWGNHSYGLIVFDPFEKVYYREVKLPVNNVTSLNDEAPECDYRKYVILVYDENFDYLGKSEIIEGINLTMEGGNFFISEKGLHLFKADQDNEDLMQFSTFKLVK